MPSLASLARDAALATTVFLATANLAPASAQQQMANAGSQGVTIETAGQVALEMCQRRGVQPMRMPDCVRDERNRMVEQISIQAQARQQREVASTAQANGEAECARKLQDLARNPATLSRGQAILGSQRPSEYGVCRLVDALTRG